MLYSDWVNEITTHQIAIADIVDGIIETDFTDADQFNAIKLTIKASRLRSHVSAISNLTYRASEVIADS